jgi:hypothetical protein
MSPCLRIALVPVLAEVRLQIFTIIIELVVVALISILADRWFSTKGAVIALCVCLPLLGYLHRGELKMLFSLKSPDAKSNPLVQPQPAPTPNPSKLPEQSPNKLRKPIPVPTSKVQTKSSEEGTNVTVDAGPSTNSKYAFDSRFILTNHNPLSITGASYICEVPGIDSSKTPLRLNVPVKIWPVASGPIGDVAPGRSFSIYCDFSGADFLLGSIENTIVQIWISYTYNNHNDKEGFQFLAIRKFEDGSYVWLPRGAGQELLTPTK